MDKILSIFCDESGDTGEYAKHSPYYIVSLVFHDQSIDLKQHIKTFDNALDYYGLSNHLIHTGPLIRREEPYKSLEVPERKSIFKKMFYFMLKADISYKTFIYEKSQFHDIYSLESKMTKDIISFVDSYEFFKSFDKIILYYDYGQQSITRIMNLIMATCFVNHEVRKINPYDYKLFQVADLVCSLELINKKIETQDLTKSEKAMFHSKSDFKKDYIKNYSKKILK